MFKIFIIILWTNQSLSISSTYDHWYEFNTYSGCYSAIRAGVAEMMKDDILTPPNGMRALEYEMLDLDCKYIYIFEKGQD